MNDYYISDVLLGEPQYTVDFKLPTQEQPIFPRDFKYNSKVLANHVAMDDCWWRSRSLAKLSGRLAQHGDIWYSNPAFMEDSGRSSCDGLGVVRVETLAWLQRLSQ